MFVELSGKFNKIAFESDVGKVLLRGLKDRPAGRFNRVGQDALYLSRSEHSAKVALSKYVKHDDPPRVIVQYAVDPCTVLDLRTDQAKDLLQASRGDWQQALREGGIPESWVVADKIRQLNCVGLIDPSRKNPNTWHVTLFRWNDADSPQVSMIGQSAAISM